MNDVERTDPSPPESAAQALSRSRAGVSEQHRLWTRVENATAYLRRRAEINHFAEGIEQSMRERQR